MITEKITSENAMSEGQRKQIKRLLEDGFDSRNLDSILDSLNLSKDAAQEILKKGNLVKEHIEASVIASLKENSIIDKRFGSPVAEFKLTVPADYKHDTCIDSFAKRVKKEKTTYYYNNDFNSQNFAKASVKLEPGKTYNVKIIPILETVTSEDCMKVLRSHNAILVGGQGATLVYDLAKDQLPKGKWTVSFYEKDSLWKDASGDHRVPSVFARSDGDFEFDLGFFEGEWLSDDCLLCFCD